MSASYQAFKAEVLHKASDSQVVKGKAYITYPRGRLTLAEKPFDSVVVIGKKTRLTWPFLVVFPREKPLAGGN